MFKSLFFLVLGMLLFQNVKAQKADTLLYYMKNSGQSVTNKDSADYFLIIMPLDSNENLYPVFEYYINGKIKEKALSANNKYRRLLYEGPCISYYPNGYRKSITNYKNGTLSGEASEYYPNGKLYFVESHYGKIDQFKFVECRDTSGNVLAENGNGKWQYFDWDKKTVTNEGKITDSLQDGEWHGILSDTSRYECIFSKGKSVSGIGYDKSGTPHHFKDYQIEPSFKGGPAGFNAYLASAVKFPAIDKTNGVSGKVIITFVVGRDGNLTDVKALRAPSETMAEASIAAVSASPRWNPAYQYGLPVRIQYTISFAFSLADAK